MIEALQVLTENFELHDARNVVIGALARDVVTTHFFEIEQKRATKDIDVGLYVDIVPFCSCKDGEAQNQRDSVLDTTECVKPIKRLSKSKSLMG